jgi:hypothetical protein
MLLIGDDALSVSWMTYHVESFYYADHSIRMSPFILPSPGGGSLSLCEQFILISTNQEGPLCRITNFADLSPLILLRAVAAVSGVDNPLKSNSLLSVERITTRVGFFAAPVVRNSLTL